MTKFGRTNARFGSVDGCCRPFGEASGRFRAQGERQQGGNHGIAIAMTNWLVKELVGTLRMWAAAPIIGICPRSFAQSASVKGFDQKGCPRSIELVELRGAAAVAGRDESV